MVAVRSNVRKRPQNNRMQMPLKQDLIEQARNGDEQAFRQLVERHQQRVRATAISMLGSVPEAEDVAQETFIRFHRALQDFRGEAKLSTYLSRIAINLSLNELKRKQRSQRWLTFSRTDEATPDLSASPDRQDLKDSLQKALQMLRPDSRAVVTLRLVEGYSVQETADILKLPKGTVASRLARAQQQLRKILDQWL